MHPFAMRQSITAATVAPFDRRSCTPAAAPKINPTNQTPGTGLQEIGIDGPSQSAPHDQRSQQFRSDPNGLAEPRIKRIL